MAAAAAVSRWLGFELGFELLCRFGVPLGAIYICFGTIPNLVQLGYPRESPNRTPIGSEPTSPGHTGLRPGITGHPV